MPSKYICPYTKTTLTESTHGLVREDEYKFLYLPCDFKKNPTPNFLKLETLHENSLLSYDMYQHDKGEEIYDNFLSWLFSTFDESEENVRKKMVSKLNLKEGQRILVTGCGLGNDLPYILSSIGNSGELYAQDLSSVMVQGAKKRLQKTYSDLTNVYFSVGNAAQLPFPDDFFDGAFHFGGINLFDDVKAAITEMDRVVKLKGKIVFGDEGVAPWLKDKEFGKIAINNNKLWSADVPLTFLPETCSNVNISWILGNCFYLIDYEVSDTLPHMNMDVVHKGRRGGTMRTRYFGQLEGIDLKLKEKALAAAQKEGKSINEWLENALTTALNTNGSNF